MINDVVYDQDEPSNRLLWMTSEVTPNKLLHCHSTKLSYGQFPKDSILKRQSETQFVTSQLAVMLLTS